MKNHLFYFILSVSSFGLITYLLETNQSITKVAVKASIFGLFMAVYNYYITTKKKKSKE